VISPSLSLSLFLSLYLSLSLSLLITARQIDKYARKTRIDLALKTFTHFFVFSSSSVSASAMPIKTDGNTEKIKVKTAGLAPMIKTEMTEQKLKESQICIEHLEMKKKREVQAMAFDKERHDWEKKEHGNRAEKHEWEKKEQDNKEEKHTWDRERFFWEQERIQSTAINNQYLVLDNGTKLPADGVIIAVDEGAKIPTNEVVVASESADASAN
jgi:hypothetical protein